jgi:putative copper export protein
MSKDAKYYWSRFALYATFMLSKILLVAGGFLAAALIESRFLGNPTAGKSIPIIVCGAALFVIAALIVSRLYADHDLRERVAERLRRRLEPDYLSRYLEARERNDLESLKDYEDDRELPKRLALRTAYR